MRNLLKAGLHFDWKIVTITIVSTLLLWWITITD